MKINIWNFILNTLQIKQSIQDTNRVSKDKEAMNQARKMIDKTTIQVRKNHESKARTNINIRKS